MDMEALHVAVGSSNPAKVKAVELSFAQVFPEAETISLRSFSTESGVSDQPMDDDETKTGAMNRARNAAQQYKDSSEGGNFPDFSVGLEGGVCEVFSPSSDANCKEEVKSLHCCAWMAVFQPSTGAWGLARTSSFPLPPQICNSILQGTELGYACDAFFKTSGSKKELGAVGLLTRGVIDRIKYYEHALLMALIPFINQGAFFSPTVTNDHDHQGQGQQSVDENNKDAAVVSKRKGHDNVCVVLSQQEASGNGDEKNNHDDDGKKKQKTGGGEAEPGGGDNK